MKCWIQPHKHVCSNKLTVCSLSLSLGIDQMQVLLKQQEIRGEEIDFILNNYPPQTPVSLLFEEEDPGSLPFITKEQERELEYALVTQSKGESE